MTELKVNGGKRSRLQSQTALIVYLFYYINDPHVQLPLCLILIAYIALTINNFTFFYFLIKAKAFQQLKLTPFIALTTLSTTDKQRNILNRTMYEYIWSQHLRPVSFCFVNMQETSSIRLLKHYMQPPYEPEFGSRESICWQSLTPDMFYSVHYVRSKTVHTD